MSKELKKGRVGFFRHQKSGCFYYRTLQKMEALQRSGVDVELIDLNTDIDFDNFVSFQFYGIYPFSIEKVLEFMKSEGKKIVYDTDDALGFIDETNPFYGAVKRDAWSQKQILPYADEVTVSTPKMKEYIQSLRSDVPITILPNCYSESDWTFPRPKREGIRIGYAGSPTHLPDLLHILPIIKNLQAKYDVKFLLMGFGPYDYKTSFKQIRYVSTPQAEEMIQKVQSLLEEIKWEWIPFVPFEQYFPTLINLSLDFGLCPLQNTPFNQHRSAIKALEYTMSGALAVASLIEPYNQDQTSVLTLDPDWENKLEYLINHPQEVERQKQIHLTWAKENRNIDNQVPLLKQVYLG